MGKAQRRGPRLREFERELNGLRGMEPAKAREAERKLKEAFPNWRDLLREVPAEARSLIRVDTRLEVKGIESSPIGRDMMRDVARSGGGGVERMLREQGLDVVDGKITGQPKPGSEAAEMQAAFERTQHHPTGSKERADAFHAEVLPILARSAERRFGIEGLARDIVEFSRGASENVATEGRGVNKERSPDTNYPPRGAHEILRGTEYYKAFGVTESAVREAEGWIQKVGTLTPPEGKYGPTIEQVRQLDPRVAQAFENVTNFFASGSPSYRELSQGEKALAANMLANNTTWNMTNYQRAGSDASRANVMERDGVANTYAVNVAIQAKRGPSEAIEMVLIDASQYARKGLEPQLLREQGLSVIHGQISGTPNSGTVTARLQAAFERTQSLPTGSRERAEAFHAEVLPLLMEGVQGRLGLTEAQIGRISEYVRTANDAVVEVGKGMKDKETPDTNYPPRGAHEFLRNTDYYKEMGVTEAAVREAEGWIREVGTLEPPEGKYGPTLEQVRELNPTVAEAFEVVTRFFESGERTFDSLTPGQQALAANMLANNIGWHMTNYQRAGGDASRASVTERGGVANTYPVNISLQTRRGPNEAIEMVLIDASQYARKGLEPQ